MLAIGTALGEGADVPLDAFVSGAPFFLSSGQHRYFADQTQFPPDLCTNIGCSRRAYIARSSGAPRLEVCWASSRSVLHETIDQGPTGYLVRHYLFGIGGLRGTCMPDPHHRRHTWWLNDVRATGAQNMKLETALLLSFRKGPWSGASNFSRLSAAAEDYFKHSTSDTCNIFAFLYEDIVLDMFPGESISNKGSGAHMSHTFECVKECPFWHLKGGKVKRSQWFQWQQEAPTLTRWWSTLLLVLLSHALDQGWYKNIASTPLYSNSFEPQGAATNDTGEDGRKPEEKGPTRLSAFSPGPARGTRRTRPSNRRGGCRARCICAATSWRRGSRGSSPWRCTTRPSRHVEPIASVS